MPYLCVYVCVLRPACLPNNTCVGVSNKCVKLCVTHCVLTECEQVKPADPRPNIYCRNFGHNYVLYT
jgi:hypothetical protein